MNMPKKIKVACFDIDVEEWHPKSAKAKDDYGQFSSTELTIGIDSSIQKVLLVDTLIHEIYHSIYWAYDLHDEDSEERIVNVMATGFTQVLRDNPDVLEFIQENLK